VCSSDLEDNTTLIRLPLLRVAKIQAMEYNLMKKAFIFDFFHEMYSRYNTKEIFYTLYLPVLLYKILSGDFFILKYLINGLMDKNRLKRLNNYKMVSKY
jgi:hypothetical protein